MSGNNGLPQTFAWWTQHKAPQSGVVLPRKGFFAHTRWGLMRAFGFVLGTRSFFCGARFFFFVVLRSLASAARLKDRVFLRVEKWKRCAKINNK